MYNCTSGRVPCVQLTAHKREIVPFPAENVTGTKMSLIQNYTKTSFRPPRPPQGHPQPHVGGRRGLIWPRWRFRFFIFFSPRWLIFDQWCQGHDENLTIKKRPFEAPRNGRCAAARRARRAIVAAFRPQHVSMAAVCDFYGHRPGGYRDS